MWIIRLTKPHAANSAPVALRTTDRNPFRYQTVQSLLIHPNRRGRSISCTGRLNSPGKTEQSVSRRVTSRVRGHLIRCGTILVGLPIARIGRTNSASGSLAGKSAEETRRCEEYRRRGLRKFQIHRERRTVAVKRSGLHGRVPSWNLGGRKKILSDLRTPSQLTGIP